MEFPKEFAEKVMAVYPKNLSLQLALKRGDVETVRHILEGSRDIREEELAKARKRFSEARDLLVELSQLESEHKQKHMLTP